MIEYPALKTLRGSIDPVRKGSYAACQRGFEPVPETQVDVVWRGKKKVHTYYA